MGVMRDMPLQKYVHDAMVFLHSEDTDGAAKLGDRRSGRRLPAAAGRLDGDDVSGDEHVME